MTPAPSRAPRGRWYAEISRSGSSRLRRPTIIDRSDLQPTILPTVNGLPRIELPVPKTDDWLAYRGATLDVWYDGIKQPIGELEAVEQRPDATILKGRGGLELLDRVQEEVQSDTASNVATSVLSNVTYSADVDAFDNTTATNVTVQSADTTTEFQDVLPTPTDTDPWEISSGTLQPLQSLFFFDTTADMTQSGTGAQSDAAYNNGDAETFAQNGDRLDDGDFTLEYDIPSGSVGLAIRFESTDFPGIDVFLDGTNISDMADDNLDATLAWQFDDNLLKDFAPGGIAAGSHTLALDQTDGGGGGTASIDCIAVYDTRYSWTFDDTVDGDQHLENPDLYPTIPIEFDNAEVAKSVTGARFEGTFSNTTSNAELIELTNELSDDWTASSANVDTFETDFGDLGPTARAQVTLGGVGTRTTRSPTTGFNAQGLESFTLKADTDDTPLVVEQGYDDQVRGVLNEIADVADAVWEYRLNSSDQGVVTWTYPNQRSDDRDPDAADWRYEETVEGAYDEVTVKGGAQSAEDERFDANHGTPVALANDGLLTGSETVYEPGTTPLVTFNRGADYELAVIGGEITTLSTGSMTDGTEYGIDYRYRPAQTVDNGASSPRQSPTIDIPSLTTTRGCGQAALRILSDVDSPLKTGRVVIPATATDWNVTDALTPSVFPSDETVQLKSVEAVPGQVILTVETRQSLSDVVSDVRAQLQLVSQRG